MKQPLVLAAVAAGTAAALSACSGEDASKGAGVTIIATDKTCEVAKTAFEPGPVAFTVTNNGSQTTEVYVYGETNGAFTKVISEVENIGPGLSRDMAATLSGGRYEIACKPGQTGDGIRTPITVSGSGESASPSTKAEYDREIEVDVTASGVEGADGLSATTGQKIEFKLGNKSNAKRELEIINPAGRVVAEIEADAGGAAETVVALDGPGTWTLKIEGDGMTEVEKKLSVR